MKKHTILILLTCILGSCNNPGGRSWIIPVNIDPSDLVYTPAQFEQYQLRRNQLLSKLEEGFVVLKSTENSGDHLHGFRPNNYFYYLTGYDAPDSYLILSNHGKQAFSMSLPMQSIRSMIYNGESLTAEQIQKLYIPDRLLSYGGLRMLLDSIIQTGAPVYMDRSDRFFYNDLQGRIGEDGETELRDVAELIDEMRVIKGSFEIGRIQKACNITSRAIVNVLKGCAPGMYEFEMESIIEGTFLQYGAARPGFPSIVGSGPNSTILHYEANKRLMENGELLLIDIGAEYGYYTADISRTIPVNGRFTKDQQVIYQLVLDAQKAAIEVMKPGKLIWDGHLAAEKVIVDGLYALGLMTDSSSSWQSSFYILYPSSHYLGMDVHDVGDYGGYPMAHYHGSGAEDNGRVLEPGMVLTIEPGLYFREKGLDQLYEIFGRNTDSTEIAEFINRVGPVYEKYINIGVRLEDDILITKEGNINLSRYAPKEIADIEQLMR